MHASLGSEPITVGWVRTVERIPVELYEILFTHRDPFVRAAFAGRRDIQPLLMIRFTNDPSSSVLASAASDPQAARQILEKAIAHEDWAPRQQACLSQNLPDDLLLSHYLHFGWVENMILVNKKGVPKVVMMHIANLPVNKGPDGKDKNEDIRVRALKRLGLWRPSENGNGDT